MPRPAKLSIFALWDDVSLKSLYQLYHSTVVDPKKFEGPMHEFPHWTESGHSCWMLVDIYLLYQPEDLERSFSIGAGIG
jgi:hypothetical protein